MKKILLALVIASSMGVANATSYKQDSHSSHDKKWDKDDKHHGHKDKDHQEVNDNTFADSNTSTNTNTSNSNPTTNSNSSAGIITNTSPSNATGGANTLGNVTGGSNALGNITGGSSQGGSITGLTSTGGSVGDTSTGSITGGNVANTNNNTNSTGSIKNGDQSTSTSTGDQSAKSSIGDQKLSSDIDNTTSNRGGDQSIKSDVNAKTGDNSATTGSNKSSTNVDASDNSSSSYSSSYQSLAYVLPDMPSTPSTHLASPMMQTQVTSCSALVDIQREEVTGVYQGLLFKTRLNQGHNDSVKVYKDENGNEKLFKIVNVAGKQLLVGNQLHITTAVISLGGSRQLGLGGGSVSGDYGQGSFGGSSQTQRVVTNIQAVPCIVGEMKADKAVNIAQ